MYLWQWDAVWLLGWLVGAGLLVVAWWGFRALLRLRPMEDTGRPQCAACGYIVLVASEGKCPECGNALAGRGTMIGNELEDRRNRWGALLLVSVLLAIVTLVISWNRTYDWRKFLLLSDLYGRLLDGDAKVQLHLRDRLAATKSNGVQLGHDVVLQQQMSRPAFDALVPRILTKQRAFTGWSPRFGDLLEWGRTQGWLSDADWSTYLLQRKSVQYQTHPMAKAGTTTSVWCVVNGVVFAGSNIGNPPAMARPLGAADFGENHLTGIRRYRFGNETWRDCDNWVPDEELATATHRGGVVTLSTYYVIESFETFTTPADVTGATTLDLEVVTRLYDPATDAVVSKSVEVQSLPVQLTPGDSDIYFGSSVDADAMREAIEVTRENWTPLDEQKSVLVATSLLIEAPALPMSLAARMQLTLDGNVVDASTLVADRRFRGIGRLRLNLSEYAEARAAGGGVVAIEFIPEPQLARESTLAGPFYPHRFTVPVEIEQANDPRRRVDVAPG